MLTKCRHIMVEGRLKLNSWETEEGVKRSKLTVVAENINLTPSNPNPAGQRQGDLQAVGASSSSSSGEDMPF